MANANFFQKVQANAHVTSTSMSNHSSQSLSDQSMNIKGSGKHTFSCDGTEFEDSCDISDPGALDFYETMTLMILLANWLHGLYLSIPCQPKLTVSSI